MTPKKEKQLMDRFANLIDAMMKTGEWPNFRKRMLNRLVNAYEQKCLTEHETIVQRMNDAIAFHAQERLQDAKNLSEVTALAARHQRDKVIAENQIAALLGNVRSAGIRCATLSEGVGHLLSRERTAEAKYAQNVADLLAASGAQTSMAAKLIDKLAETKLAFYTIEHLAGTPPNEEPKRS